MFDQRDRFKFQWLDPRSKQDNNVRVGIVITNAMTFMVFAVLVFIFLRNPKPQEPQEVKAEEELLTVPMKDSLVIETLSRAGWCELKRSKLVNGDLQICSPEGDGARSTYDEIILGTDSLAPTLARELPHLFKYVDDDGDRMFQLPRQNGAVTMPVGLIRRLIEHGDLTLP